MRSFKYIWRFIAVGFVLVLSGKVSKASLFTAYIKTIAEVEVRNTQDLKDGDSQVEIVKLTNVKSVVHRVFPQGSAWVSIELFKFNCSEYGSLQLPLYFDYQRIPTHPFSVSAPIRAPGLS